VRRSSLNLKLVSWRGLSHYVHIRSFKSTTRKLFANETLYQLSYTPNMIDFSELHDISGTRKMLVYTSNVIGSATKRSTTLV
jgi:hypothetical protein